MNAVQQAKEAQGYIAANKRPMCRTCTFSKQVIPSGAANDTYPWRCTTGGFGTTAQACCNRYQAGRVS